MLFRSAYVELEGFAADVKDARDRDTILARAKRYRAQILQLGAGVAGNAGARGLLAPPANQPDAICALTLRAPYQPYENWDLIEQAETHYLTALVAHRLDNVQIEAAQKALCQQAYQTALEQLPKRNFWLSRSARLLKQEVKAGLLRVGFAAEGKYDDEWLGVR